MRPAEPIRKQKAERLCQPRTTRNQKFGVRRLVTAMRRRLVAVEVVERIESVPSLR
jgi:hypothetical protein